MEGAPLGAAHDFPLIQFDEVLSLLKVSEYLRKEWLEPAGQGEGSGVRCEEKLGMMNGECGIVGVGTGCSVR